MTGSAQDERTNQADLTGDGNSSSSSSERCQLAQSATTSAARQSGMWMGNGLAPTPGLPWGPGCSWGPSGPLTLWVASGRPQPPGPGQPN